MPNVDENDAIIAYEFRKPSTARKIINNGKKHAEIAERADDFVGAGLRLMPGNNLKKEDTKHFCKLSGFISGCSIEVVKSMSRKQRELSSDEYNNFATDIGPIITSLDENQKNIFLGEVFNAYGIVINDEDKMITKVTKHACNFFRAALRDDDSTKLMEVLKSDTGNISAKLDHMIHYIRNEGKYDNKEKTNNGKHLYTSIYAVYLVVKEKILLAIEDNNAEQVAAPGL